MTDIITITGDVGSGKSTVGKILADALGYRHISTGTMQREVAASLGITTLELNEASMKDRKVDDAIDSYLKRLNDEGSRLVLDSRMAWHFVSRSLKVFVGVDPAVGASRVLSARRSSEVHDGLVDAMRNNLRRKSLEIQRFAGLYGVRCDDLANFDLVVDATWVAPQCVAEVILEAYRGRQSGHPSPHAWLCPKSLYPTKGISGGLSQLSFDRAPTEGWSGTVPFRSAPTEEVFASMSARGYDPRFPIEAVRFGYYFYIRDGHKRASCAVRLGLDHVPCMLHEREDAATVQQIWISEWETAHGFRFPSYPDSKGDPQMPEGS